MHLYTYILQYIMPHYMLLYDAQGRLATSSGLSPSVSAWSAAPAVMRHSATCPSRCSAR